MELCLNCEKDLTQIDINFDFDICLNCQLSCVNCKNY